MPMLSGRFFAACAAAARGPCCAACLHRVESRDALEQRIAGLTTLSSGFGASVADSRLCRLHDQLVSPGDYCARFEPRAQAETIPPR
ncbi:hypothetical protein [Paraburkholderia sp. ZP32-5]|uniref:hypothetical protein n=1 Tax=Paraburkholderia sp. ZP32-5 TaxID=2883245 RepID=UPI001F3E8145|nr:hypothetical protein [Paraburkholderia sp. ZP32-5]